MDNITTSLEKKIKKQRRIRRWKRIVSVLGSLVVFVTTYALILPAITMEQMCEKEEHAHVTECYEEIIAETIYTCQEAIHSHAETCYGDEQKLICGLADFVVHKHSERCYGEDDTLLCELSEIEEHKHTDSCYSIQTKENIIVHEHLEECYVKEKGELICGIEETEEHLHNDECYEWPDSLTCEYKDNIEKIEIIEEKVLKCDETEIILHEHDKECVDSSDGEEILVCNMLEVKGHNHDENCITVQGDLNQEPKLICEKEEHTHHSECFTDEKVLLNLDQAVFSTKERATNPYDLVNYVTSVTVQHRAPGSYVWQDVVDGKVQAGDELRFDVHYRIPGETLSTANRVVTYQAPVKVTKAESGYVKNGDEIVGTYNISEDGLITITFYEEYASSNQDGADITGHIAFQADVDKLNTDTTGKIEIPFKETITIQITNKENNTSDLQVTKKAQNIDRTNGTLTYVITVTSENGTGDAVTLTDVMTNIKGTGDVTVKKNGQDVSNLKTSVNGKGNFELTLPKMNAKDVYTITYNAKVPNAESMNGILDVRNVVNVKSEDKLGGTLVDSDSVTSSFERNIVTKAGALDGNKITWTIVINKSGIDIGNWTLSDKLDGESYIGTVTISPHPNYNNGGSLKTTLPYKFPSGSNKQYTVTYTTDAPSGEMGSMQATNTATMTPPNGTGISGGANVIVGTFNPLDKVALGVMPNGKVENGNKLADFEWQITIDAKDGAIKPYSQSVDGKTHNAWVYSDELWNEDRHWITGAQLKELSRNLDNNFNGDFTIFAYIGEGGAKYRNPVPLDQVADNDKFWQFRILFHDTLEKGDKITFTYRSTVDIGTGTHEVSVTNRCDINSKASKQVSQTYRPVVTKVDKKGAGDTTEHNIDELFVGGYNGVLGWDVHVKIPDMNYTNPLIILEDIPDGTELLANSSSQWNLSFGGHEFNFKQNGNGELSYDGYKITAELIDGAYKITVPADCANKIVGTTIRIEVRVKIKDNLVWNEAIKSFENVVTVSTGTTQLGEASQTQNIRNPIANKSSGTVSDNVVPYSIVINEAEKDLVSGEDTLNLSDVLNYKKSTSGNVNAILVMDSVKLFKNNTDGTKTDITAEYGFTYSESVEGDQVYKNINMKIPDSTSLTLEYSYRISGGTGVEVALNNSVTLEGVHTSVDKDKFDFKVRIQESNAGATLVGVKIVKVDAENYAFRLMGATFSLREWNGKEYVEVGQYETNDLGVFYTGKLESNVAYQLVETASPLGYQVDPTPYEFYIAGTGTTINKPTSFDGMILNNGDSIIITNKPMKYELPETGGIGTDVFTISGVALMSASLLKGCLNKRKRERRVK